VETSPEGKKILHRTAPSAGQTFPLEVYVAFAKGLFPYEPKKHVLHLVNDKDIREKLSEAAMAPLNKEAIKTAPLTIILVADNKRALADWSYSFDCIVRHGLRSEKSMRRFFAVQVQPPSGTLKSNFFV